jgi:hypothetical protein
MNVITNLTNWDATALLSILMVIIAVVIIVWLSMKVAALIKQDAASHKDQPP